MEERATDEQQASAERIAKVTLDIEAQRRALVVSGLRMLADYLEKNPKAPIPGEPNITIYHLRTKQEAEDIARLPGLWQKQYCGDSLTLVQRFGGINYQAFFSRNQICKRVVTGMEKVMVMDYSHAPMKTIEREKVEWECEGILAETEEE